MPGAELLIPYGKAYWSAREALLANAKKKQRPLPASKNNSGLWAILKAVALMYPGMGGASPPASRIAPTVAGPFPGPRGACDPRKSRRYRPAMGWCSLENVFVGPLTNNRGQAEDPDATISGFHEEWDVADEAAASLQGSAPVSLDAVDKYLSLCSLAKAPTGGVALGGSVLDMKPGNDRRALRNEFQNRERLGERRSLAPDPFEIHDRPLEQDPRRPGMGYPGVGVCLREGGSSGR